MGEVKWLGEPSRSHRPAGTMKDRHVAMSLEKLPGQGRIDGNAGFGAGTVTHTVSGLAGDEAMDPPVLNPIGVATSRPQSGFHH